MKKEPPVGSRQNLLLTDKSHCAQKMRVWGPLLPSAGKINPPQDGRLLVRVFMESAAHEGVESGFEFFELFRKHQQGCVWFFPRGAAPI